MSKPKHYRRGKGRYMGYGYSTTDMVRNKGDWDYKNYLINEIEDLKRGRKRNLVDKLRKYLKRVS